MEELAPGFGGDNCDIRLLCTWNRWAPETTSLSGEGDGSAWFHGLPEIAGSATSDHWLREIVDGPDKSDIRLLASGLATQHCRFAAFNPEKSYLQVRQRPFVRNKDSEIKCPNVWRKFSNFIHYEGVWIFYIKKIKCGRLTLCIWALRLRWCFGFLDFTLLSWFEFLPKKNVMLYFSYKQLRWFAWIKNVK